MAAVAAFQAMEALKLLTGAVKDISPYLTKFDFWTGQMQRTDVRRACNAAACPCCKRSEFEFLRSGE